MPNTPILGLPYPTPDQTADVPRDLQALAVALDTIFPAGLVSPFAGATAPTGWLLCDGAVLVRASYQRLFDAIGTAYNVGGEAVTDFRLPDLRGRAPVGVDGSGLRITAAERNRGQAGGAEKHSQPFTIPNHTHSGTTPAHGHAAPGVSIHDADLAINGPFFGTRQTGSTGSTGIDGTEVGTRGRAGKHAHGVTVGAVPDAAGLAFTTGDPSARNGTTGDGSSLQPYQIVNFIIKT